MGSEYSLGVGKIKCRNCNTVLRTGKNVYKQQIYKCEECEQLFCENCLAANQSSLNYDINEHYFSISQPFEVNRSNPSIHSEIEDKHKKPQEKFELRTGACNICEWSKFDDEKKRKNSVKRKSKMSIKVLSSESESSSKFSISRPLNPKKNINIKYDENTQSFTGVPEEMKKSLVETLNSKSLEERKFSTEEFASQRLSSARDPSIKSPESYAISKPLSTTHLYHVTVNASSELGFDGLPEDWKEILHNLDLSLSEILSNPREVLHLLNYKRSGSIILPSLSQANSLMRKKASMKASNPFKHFKILKKIGIGGFGVVYAAKEVSTGRNVAIKQLPQFTQDYDNIQFTFAEIAQLQLSKHDNIISYYGAYNYNSSIWCIIEYMNGGNLYDLISALPFNSISEGAVAYVLLQIVKALAYLHSRNRIHRDVKSDNVLLSTDLQIKLTDFGYCVQLTKEKMCRTTQVGTVVFMAPEIIGNQLYDVKCDIWSLGILCLELCEGIAPYMHDSEDRILFKILSKEPPQLSDQQKWSHGIKDFIKRCLVKDPKKRASAEELLDHEFLKRGRMEKCKKEYSDIFYKFLTKTKSSSVLKDMGLK